MLRQRYENLLEKLNLNRRDVALFFTSLLLAIGIWLLYNLSLSYSATLSARVYVRSDLPGRFERSSDAALLEARCRTSGYQLLNSGRKTRKTPVTVFVPKELLHNKGNNVYSISANELSGYVGEIFGADVRLESFLSPSYDFTFAVENHKKVPVVAVSMLDFKSQYMLKSPMQLVPDSVFVYGDPVYLDNIERVYTKSISLSKLKSATNGVVKLDAPKNVRISDDEVAYSLDVTRYVEVEKTARIVLRNAPDGKNLSIYPSTAKVLFRCVFPMPVDKTDEVVFYIDYRDFAKSLNGRCVARTDFLPQGIIDYRMDPQIFDCVENIR